MPTHQTVEAQARALHDEIMLGVEDWKGDNPDSETNEDDVVHAIWSSVCAAEHPTIRNMTRRMLGF